MSCPVYERATSLREANIGDELVGLDIAAGNCFGFNAVATTVWKHLESPKTFDELKVALLDAYVVDDRQCTLELSELLESMLNLGLVQRL